MSIPNPTHIFHITSIENLRMILDVGELRAKRVLDQVNVEYTNIAHRNIQDYRAHTPVPCGPKGVLHDYVPFYFGPRSPMLFTIHKGNVHGFEGGQSSIIHLVSTVQTVRAAKLDFVFTDGHGIMEITSFYDDLARLDVVDWPLMHSRYWSDTCNDHDRKRRRQAEFLVHDRFPVRLIGWIGVFDQPKRKEVKALLAEFGLTISVATKPKWYY